MEAVEDCARQAGGNLEALKYRKAVRPSTEVEEVDYDIVVVGAGGGAGTAAALAASEKNNRVLLLEKKQLAQWVLVSMQEAYLQRKALYKRKLVKL